MGEITVSAKGSDFVLLVPQRIFNEAGLEPNCEYELVKVRKGIWVLVAKEKEKADENPLDANILKMVRENSLKERVEGKFEQKLGKEELARFKEMLKEGRLIAFKLSPKYKKAVYKTREEVEGNQKNGKEDKGSDARPEKQGRESSAKAEKASRDLNAKDEKADKESDAKAEKWRKESESVDAREKRHDQYSLEKDGFLIFKNPENAKILSQRFKEDIEDGNIRGIKSFDGFFYIAETKLYEKYRGKALSAIKAEEGIDSKKLAEMLGVSKTLGKIVCELLKDDGEIIEKRKDSFQAIEG